jgi:hypothetical protein
MDSKMPKNMGYYEKEICRMTHYNCPPLGKRTSCAHI